VPKRQGDEHMFSDYENPGLSMQAVSSRDQAAGPASHTQSAQAVVRTASASDRRVPHEKLLGAKEVAHWLGVSRAWVFEHSNGRRRPFLPSVKLGKSVRYRPVDVDAFIVECERFSRRGAA
jgi:predicted DNA-binding transcriptional regulator AlpA